MFFSFVTDLRTSSLKNSKQKTNRHVTKRKWKQKRLALYRAYNVLKFENGKCHIVPKSKMAHKVKNNHYVATHRSGVDSPSSGAYLHRASSKDENDSHRAPSERTVSEYTVLPYLYIILLQISMVYTLVQLCFACTKIRAFIYLNFSLISFYFFL